MSSAFKRIGIAVPATTYAMEADPTFMATKVSDRIDLKVMQPGMPATVMITTAHRSLLRYLIAPLGKRLSTALTER